MVWPRSWECWRWREVARAVLAAETPVQVQQQEPEAETHWGEWHMHPATV